MFYNVFVRGEKMKEKKDFGQYIQQKRKEKGLTQLEFAEKLYVTESAVSKWERGLTYPDITLITPICETLEINEHEFITASNDTEYHRLKSEAKRYRKISNTYFWLFTICYAIAIITCFIVNLTVDHQLSWFFIVLAACILAYTLVPSITRFFKNYRLGVVSGSFLVSLWILLGVCAIYTSGNWFLTAVTGTLLAYVIIMGPIYLKKYPLPNLFKNNKLLTAVTIDVIVLILLLISCAIMVGGNWLFITIVAILCGYVITMTIPIFKAIKLPKFIDNNIGLFYLLVVYLTSVILCITLKISTTSDKPILLVLPITYVMIITASYLQLLSLKKWIRILFGVIMCVEYYWGLITFFSIFSDRPFAVDLTIWNAKYLAGNVSVIVTSLATIGAILLLIIATILKNKKIK